MTEKRLLALLLLGTALFLVAFGLPMLLGQVRVDSDLGSLHLPMRHFFAEAISRGNGYIWFPLEFTGFYLHGEGEAALYHPLNQISYRMLPLAIAFELEVLRNYVFTWIGTYLFLRRHLIRRDAAAFGALAFSFSSFHVAHYMHINILAVVAHLPWLLWAIDVAVRDSGTKRAVLATAAITLLTASQILLGQPQMLWMCLIVEALYGGFLLAPGLPGRDREATLRRAAAVIASLAVAQLLGCVVAGVQLIPQWETLQLSQRSAPMKGFSNVLALHPAQVLQILSPYSSHYLAELRLYCGAVVPVLVVWVLIRRRSLGVLWPIACASLVCALLGYWLSVGTGGGLYRIQELLPVVGLFRAPARYMLLTELGLCIAASIAFADLVASATPGAPRWSWYRLAPLFVPLAVSLAATAWLLSEPELEPWGTKVLFLAAPPFQPTSPWLLAAGPALVAVATFLIVAAARGRPWASAALVVFLVIDLGSYAWTQTRIGESASLEHWLAEVEVPRLAPGLRLDYGDTRLTMSGIRLAYGYASLSPKRELPLGRYARPKRDPASVTAALRVGSIAEAYGNPVPDPLPRARLVSRARVSHDVLGDIGKIDVATTALVREPVSLAGGVPGRATITLDLPGEIHLETRAASRQLLVVSESYHPGWVARVDGEACTVLPVYGDFLGCVVEAGDHRVRFDFDPGSLRLGTSVSWIGVILSAVWLAARLHRGSGAGKAS